MSYGQKSHVAISFQSSYGTSNVTSLYHLQHLEESVGLNIPPLIDESARGVFDEGDGYSGPHTVDGDLSINAKAIPVGVLLKGLMGPATTSAVTSLTAHLFKPRTSDFDTLSAGNPITYLKHMNDTGSATLFYNLNIGAIEFGCANGEFVTAKASFVGGTLSQNVDIAASFPTGKRFTWDASSLQLNGSAVNNFRALTITINENLEAMHTLNNTKYPSRVKRTGNRSIEVGGTVIFDDQTEYQKFISQSEQSFKVSFAGPVNVGSGGTDKIEFDIPLLRYTEFKPTAAGAGKTEVSFTASAKYSTTSATSIAITLTNTQTVY